MAVAAQAGEQQQAASSAPPPAGSGEQTREERAAYQAQFFNKEITAIQESITPEVEAKLARVAAAVPGLSADSRVLDAGAGEGALIPHLQARCSPFKWHSWCPMP